MDWTEVLKLAYGGVNFPVYALLNVWIIGAHRVAKIPQTWSFAVVSAIGAALGALGGYTEAMREVGLNPLLLYRAALTGGIIGAGSCTLIGWGASAALDKSGLAPISEEKKLAEAIRDPMNPTAPQGSA